MPEPISFTIDAEAWQRAQLAIKWDVLDAGPVAALAVTLWTCSGANPERVC